MQQLELKRRLRRLMCPAEMTDPASRCEQAQAQPLAADSGKRRAPIEWRDKYALQAYYRKRM